MIHNSIVRSRTLRVVTLGGVAWLGGELAWGQQPSAGRVGTERQESPAQPQTNQSQTSQRQREATQQPEAAEPRGRVAQPRATQPRETQSRTTQPREVTEQRTVEGQRERQGERGETAAEPRSESTRRSADSRPSRQQEAWLGVYLRDRQEDREAAEGEAGVSVAGVYPSSPASRAGFRTGDRIVRLNGQEVTDHEALVDMIREMEAGSQAEVTILRNGQPLTRNVVLGRRDAFIGQYDDDRYGSFYEEEDREFDVYSSVPEHAMRMEHDRRMVEQHERIENAIRQLQQEVRQLREALQPRNQ